jgi:Transposase DDE domain
VIKPRPVQPAVEGGFTVDDFTVDAAGTVTCPARITRQVTARNAVIFGAACRACPLREKCTTAKDGRTLHLHDGLLRAARADWAADPGLRGDYMTHRPNVERAIAQIATWRGRRIKLRYRGEARNHAWLKRRTAAVNLRNLLGKGLARRDGAWVLAT